MADLKKFYQNALGKGIIDESVDYDAFAQSMTNDEDRKSFYQHATDNGLKIGTEDEFFAYLDERLQPAQETREISARDVQYEQPFNPKVKGNEAPTTEEEYQANLRRQDAAQGVEPLYNPQQPQWTLSPSATISQPVARTPYQQFEQNLQEEKTYQEKQPIFKEQWEKNDKPKLDAAWEQAQEKAKQTYSANAGASQSAKAFIPAGSVPAVELSALQQANKEKDPVVFMKEFQNAIDSDYQERLKELDKPLVRQFAEGVMSDEELAKKYQDAGIMSPEDYQMYKRYVQEQMQDYFVGMNVPKDKLDYFVQKYIQGNLIAQIGKIGTQMLSQRQFESSGTARYELENDNKATSAIEIGASLANIVTDPLMYVMPVAAKAVVGGAMERIIGSRLATAGITKSALAAQQAIALSKGLTTASKLATGSAMFLGIDTGHDVVNQIYQNGTWNPAQTAFAGLKGAVTGLLFAGAEFLGEGVQKSIGEAWNKNMGLIAGKATQFTSGTTLMLGSSVVSQLAQGVPLDRINWSKEISDAAVTQLFFDVKGGIEGAWRSGGFSKNWKAMRENPWNGISKEQIQQLNNAGFAGNNIYEVLLNLNGGKDMTSMSDSYSLDILFQNPNVDTALKYRVANILGYGGRADLKLNHVRPISVGRVEAENGRYVVRTFDNGGLTYETRVFDNQGKAEKYQQEQQDAVKNNLLIWKESLAKTFSWANEIRRVTDDAVTKTIHNYPQLSQEDAYRILTDDPSKLSPIDRAIRNQMDKVISETVKGKELVAYIREEIAKKHKIPTETVDDILKQDYAGLNKVQRDVYDDYLTRLDDFIPLQNEIAKQKKAIESGRTGGAEPAAQEPTREEVIRQRVKAQYDPITHNDGKVYSVKSAGDEGKRGYIVGDGKVTIDESDPEKPRITNNESVIVKWDNGDGSYTVEQLSTKDLDLVAIPQSAEDLIEFDTGFELTREQEVEQAKATYPAGYGVTISRGDGKTQDGTILEVTEKGVEVMTINPQTGEQDNTIIPLDAAAQMLKVKEEEIYDVDDETKRRFINGNPPDDGGTPPPIGGAALQGDKPLGEKDKPQVTVIEPNIVTMDAEQYGNSMVDFMGSKAAAVAYLESERDKADLEVKRLAKQQVTNSRDMYDFRDKYQALQAKRQQAIDTYNKLQNAIVAANNYKTPEEKAAEEARKAGMMAKREQRQKTELGTQANQAPQEKYNAAPKYYGNEIVITTPTGVALKARYALHDAFALTPSHDPFDNFNMSNGYPQTADGQSVNDRDYKDPEEKEKVNQIGNGADGRLWTNMPIQQAGIIASHNGSQQGLMLAYKNGKAGKYKDALKANIPSTGIDAAKVSEFANPEVSLELVEPFEFTTSNLSMFNAQETQRQSNTATAAKYTRALTPQAVSEIINAIQPFENIDAFFGNNIATNGLVNKLIETGVMTQRDRAALFNGEKINDTGKDTLKNVMLGTVLDPEVIKLLGDEEGLKASILRAIPQIIDNKSLNEYALTEDINNAIRALYDMRNKGLSYTEYTLQLDLETGKPASADYRPFALLLAKAMNEGGVSDFRNKLADYNNQARLLQGGQMNLLTGGVLSLTELKNQILEENGIEEREKAAVAEQLGTNVAGGATSDNQVQPAVPSDEEQVSEPAKPYPQLIFAKNYYKDKGAREIAHGIKEDNPDSIFEAADDMYAALKPYVNDMVKGGGITLIPIPSRKGKADTTFKLAALISQRITNDNPTWRDGTVSFSDVLEGNERESLYDLKKAGKSIPDGDFFGYRLKGELPQNGTIILVDGVYATGATMNAAKKAVGRDAIPLVYAYDETANDILNERKSTAETQNAEKNEKNGENILPNEKKVLSLQGNSVGDSDDASSGEVNKDDYKTYLTPEARKRFADEALQRNPNYAHPEIAFIQRAVWDGVNIPIEELMEIETIKDAQKQVDSLEDAKLELDDTQVQEYATRLLETGSAVFKNGKIVKNGDGTKDYSGEVKQERKAFIVIGRPAGGKSSVFADPLSTEHKARIIDSDDAKPWLAGFNNGIGANYVQNASTAVANAALAIAMERGDNIIVPRVGGNGCIRDAVIPLKKAGYSVELYFNEVAPDTSYMRAMARFAEEGRYLSLNYLQSVKDKPNKTFEKYKDLTLEEYEQQINSVPGVVKGNSVGNQGDISQLLGSWRGGQTSVQDGGRESSQLPSVAVGGQGQLESGQGGTGVSERLFDYAEWKNNDVPRGEKPKLVWQSERVEKPKEVKENVEIVKEEPKSASLPIFTMDQWKLGTAFDNLVEVGQRVGDDVIEHLRNNGKGYNEEDGIFQSNNKYGSVHQFVKDADGFWVYDGIKGGREPKLYNTDKYGEETTDKESADSVAIKDEAEAIVSEAASIGQPERSVEPEGRDGGSSVAEEVAGERGDVELTPDEQDDYVTTAQGAIDKIDNALDKVNGQLAVLGYYEADTDDELAFHESYGYLKSAEAKAVKDCDRLAKQLSDDLGITLQSKRKVLAKANIAPAGGDISFHLPLEDGRDLYVHFGINPNRGLYYKPDGIEESYVISDMYWRVENPNAGGMSRYGTNHNYGDLYGIYGTKFPTYDELLQDIKRDAKDYLPNVEAATKQERVKKAVEKAQRKKADKTRIPDTQQVLDLFADAVEEANEAINQEPIKQSNNGDTEVRNDGQRKSRTQKAQSAGQPADENGALGGSQRQTDEGTQSGGVGSSGEQHRVHDGERSRGTAGQRSTESVERKQSLKLSYRDEFGVEHILDANYYTLGDVYHINDRLNGDQYNVKASNVLKNIKKKVWTEIADTPVQEPEKPVAESEWKNTNNYHARSGEALAPTTPKARYDANMAAIRLLKQLQNDGRQATREEKDILAQFSGWGGLGEFFNGRPGTTYYSMHGEKSPYQEIAEVLNEDELQAAQLSRNSAYYTPAPVINTLWNIAERLGFRGGNILEGSAGIGNILALMPSDISHRSDIQAVEIDDITAGILAQLYPDAKTYHSGFEKVNIPNNSVDLAITNVPFVTGLHVYDPKESDLSKRFGNIHDFCIAKNVRKLRQGGIGIFITTNGTLDNSKDLRRWLNNDGETDVIGAFRLNRETFGGTSATSDIIVVRKRVNGLKDPRAIDVLDTKVARVALQEQDPVWNRKAMGYETPAPKEVKLVYNQYFVDHPESMGGVMGFGFEHGDTRFGGTTAGCYVDVNVDQDNNLRNWVANMEKGEMRQTTTAPTATGNYEKYDGVYPYGSLILNSKGQICKAWHGEAVPIDGINANKVKGRTKAEVLKDYNTLKSAVDEALNAQAKDITDDELKPYLKNLNAAYDGFVRKYGSLNGNTSLSFLRNDVQWASIAALENVKETLDANGKKKIEVSKTDVFSKRVVGVQPEPKADNAKDGVILSVQQFGTIRPDKIAEWLGKSAEEAEREIIDSRLGFRDPATGNIQVRHEYLSGNVREKLAYAQEHNENGQYDSNIEELRKVLPIDIPAHLIEFNVGSTWIPQELYQEYLKEKYDVGNLKLSHVGSSWVSNEQSGYGNWSLHNEKNRAEGVYSEKVGKQVYGHELMLAAMNNVPIVVSKVEKHYDGTTETITDKAATAACSDKISQIKDDFVEWARGKMQQDEELAERVQKIYNDRFNSIVPMLGVDKMFLSPHLPNQNHKYTLYDHQQQAVVRATTQPVMLAHEVGTGKTITLISSAMEMRRLGTAKKPMIVVQNATTAQFVKEAKDLYPNAKILTVSERDRTKEGRQEFYAKIKYNDWDLIIVPQSVFDMIPDSEARMRDFIQEKIEEKMHAIEAAKDAGVDSKVVSRMEKELEMLNEDLETNNMSGKRTSKKKEDKDAKKEAEQRANAAARAEAMLDRRTDDVADFDDMGIDALLIDEAHNYKHLGFATMMTRGVKGVDPSYSKRAAALYLKCQSVYERQGHRNVVFATGTPISNTAAEIWTFMKYLMPKDVLKENDIYYFDDFVHNFGKINEQLEFATNGKFKANNRFAQYGNVPELMRLWLTCADCVLTREVGQVNDKVPDIEGGKAQDIFLPQSPSLIDIMAAVRAKLDEYEHMSGKEKKENSHIPLTMYGIAKRAAIDPRLVSGNAADEPLSKTNKAVEETLRSLKDSEKYNGTVAIFCDSYQNKQTGFNLFNEMKDKLVKGGIPASKIAIIRSEMTDNAKQKIFDAVREGDIRVIMGSTQTLGTGVNIQTRLHTLIHMDAPDRPMDYTQRNGRIIRQGNMHKQWNIPVRVLRFGVEDSLDVTSYQRLKTKAGFIDSIMNGKSMIDNNLENRVIEDVEEGIFDNPVAMLSGSQFALLKSQAERDLRKWKARKEQHNIDQILIANRLRNNVTNTKREEENIKTYERRLEVLGQMIPDGKVTEYNIDGRVAHTKDELREALKAVNANIQKDVDEVRRNYAYGENHYKTVTIPISFNGLQFDVNMRLIRKSTWKDGNNVITVDKSVYYGCDALGMADVPSQFVGLENVIDRLEDRVLSGASSRDHIADAKDHIERMKQESELMRQREGKKFEHQAELDKAQALVDEYTEKMKAEMAEKEAKYAAQSAKAVDLDNMDAEDDAEDIDVNESTLDVFEDYVPEREEGETTRDYNARLLRYRGQSVYRKYQQQLEHTQDIKVRGWIMREYLNTILGHHDNWDIVFDDNGIREFAKYVAHCNDKDAEKLVQHVNSNKDITAVCVDNKYIMILGRKVTDLESVRSRYLHENQHVANRTSVQLMKDVINASNMSELAQFLYDINYGNDFYGLRAEVMDEWDGYVYLADEFISHCIQICYDTPIGGDYIEQLRKRGVTNEKLLNIIKNEFIKQTSNPSSIYLRAGRYGNPRTYGVDRTGSEETGRTAEEVSQAGLSGVSRRGSESSRRLILDDASLAYFRKYAIQTAEDRAKATNEMLLDPKFSIRNEDAPKQTGIGYKVFFRGKDGKLYPPMVANPNGEDTPIGVWLDADAAPVVGTTKTGRPQVKAGGKGTQGGSGTLAYRPGWHLGEIPYALQFNRKDEKGNKTLFPKDFVWAEVEYAADNDYQKEANLQGWYGADGKLLKGYNHAFAGLKHVPENGFYRYRTNPNPETDPWIITGAMKVNRVLTNEEVDAIVRAAGREPQRRQGERNERMDIIDAAAKSYMRAPNGKKSQLNAAQWTDVRTKNFRRWFGDWELAAKVVQIVPVQEEHGFKNFDEAREWAKGNIVGDVHQKEIGTVNISGKAIEKYLSEKAVDKSDNKDVHLSALRKLPSIIENSMVGEIHNNRDENKDIQDVVRLFSCIDINGKKYRVKTTVKRYNDANTKSKAYTYEVTKIELLEGFSATTPTKSDPVPTSNNSITGAKLLKNIESTKFLGKKLLDFSKVVDKNGEPMVVYHGTPHGDFTEFREGQPIWTFNKRNLADQYRHKKLTLGVSMSPAKDSRVIDGFMNLRNPYEITVNGAFYRIPKQIVEYDLYGKKYSWGDKPIFITAEDVVEMVREHGGYDGVIFRDMYDNMFTTDKVRGDVIVGFKPNQFKSASHNSGAYSDSYNFNEAIGDPFESAPLTRSEAVTRGIVDAAKENREYMIQALKAVSSDIKAIRAALHMQAEVDKNVVGSLLNLYMTLTRSASAWTNGDMPFTSGQIFTQVRNAIGKEDITPYVNKIMDYVVNAQAKAAKMQFDKLRNTRIDKLNISGVVSQGKVAIQGQHALKALNDALAADLTIEQLEDMIADAMDKEDNATDESLRTEYKGRMIGYTIAAQHLERLRQLQQERQQLDDQLKDAAHMDYLSRQARKELAESIRQSIRDNQIEQADAYIHSARDLKEYIETQGERAKQFLDRVTANREKILGYAAADLGSVATNPNRLRTKQGVVRQVWDAIASPIRDLQSMLRMCAPNAINGEGYLYNHFMRGWTDAADTERKGIIDAMQTLDSKIAELTNGKYKTWEDAATAIANASRNDFAVEIKDGAHEEEIPLNANNALYIYAVNKMEDGKMKLRAMNITDEDVQKLANSVRNKFGQEILNVVDWIQSDYFKQLRNRYNPTHESLFGAPMDAIDNYFPLVINPNSRQQNEDLGADDNDAAKLLAGTSTGAIKRRTKNQLPLDIRNTDFFQQVIRHISQMEHWNAFAQWNRDANILFSDIAFRNRVKNMDGTIYGKGDALYNYMKDAFKVAMGTYKPNADKFSHITLNIAKGVTAAKINFRLFTAVKQLASFPAFFTYMTDGTFVQSYLRNWMKPHETMTWAKETLPNFEKRIHKRDMGDMRLMSRSTDWQWNKRVLEWSQKYGMAANVFFDTLTCATGARAVYDSHLADYLKKGYSQEDAENRARQDAEQAFNTSQQSSEGAYLAPIQMDRNVITAALTVFRTSPIQYTRNFIYHARNIANKYGKRDEQINFRKYQYINDGLPEEQAQRAAEKDFSKSMHADVVGLVVYGALLNILWRLAGQFPYLVFGGDDDKKKEIVKKAVTGGALVSPMTGLLGGANVESMLDGYDGISGIFSPKLPFTQDIEKAERLLKQDKYAEYASQALSVLMQSSAGFDPQTAADIIARSMTTLDSEQDLDAAEKALRVTYALFSIPQAQYEQVLVDQVIDNKREYKDALKDYERYQAVHTAPLTWWYLRDEETVEKAQKAYKNRFDELIKERKELRK